MQPFSGGSQRPRYLLVDCLPIPSSWISKDSLSKAYSKSRITEEKSKGGGRQTKGKVKLKGEVKAILKSAKEPLNV